MTTEAPPTAGVDSLVATAAVTAAATLATSEPLTPGHPGRDVSSLDHAGQAVIASFTGSRTGELALVVDPDLTSALQDASLDLAHALTPTMEAIAAAVGPVVLGPLQTMDARLALHRVLAHADAAMVPLLGASGVRAGVAVGVEAVPVAARPVLADLSAQRLDLLRGVEMEATAELGRTKMTVNDLLSLRTGAVVELDRSAGSAADLYVNGRLIARGEVVVVDENYGLRITQVVADDTLR